MINRIKVFIYYICNHYTHTCTMNHFRTVYIIIVICPYKDLLECRLCLARSLCAVWPAASKRPTSLRDATTPGFDMNLFSGLDHRTRRDCKKKVSKYYNISLPPANRVGQKKKKIKYRYLLYYYLLCMLLLCLIFIISTCLVVFQIIIENKILLIYFLIQTESISTNKKMYG